MTEAAKMDNENRKMLTEKAWRQGMKEEGFQQKFTFETDKGTLDLSASQVGALCSKVLNQNGEAIIKGKTFKVVTNGKTGMEIRYFFNLVSDWKKEVPQDIQDAAQALGGSVEKNEINVDEIPW